MILPTQLVILLSCVTTWVPKYTQTHEYFFTQDTQIHAHGHSQEGEWQVCVWKGLSSRLSKLRVLPVFQVKRIPEYEKYLTELLQGTPEAHPDYEQLSRAVKKVQDVSIPTPVSLL